MTFLVELTEDKIESMMPKDSANIVVKKKKPTKRKKIAKIKKTENEEKKNIVEEKEIPKVVEQIEPKKITMPPKPKLIGKNIEDKIYAINSSIAEIKKQNQETFRKINDINSDIDTSFKFFMSEFDAKFEKLFAKIENNFEVLFEKFIKMTEQLESAFVTFPILINEMKNYAEKIKEIQIGKFSIQKEEKEIKNEIQNVRKKITNEIESAKIKKPIESLTSVNFADPITRTKKLLDILRTKLNKSAHKFAKELEKTRDHIIRIYDYHPILDELTTFANKLKKLPEDSEIEDDIANFLMEQIDVWKEKIVSKE